LLIRAYFNEPIPLANGILSYVVPSLVGMFFII